MRSIVTITGPTCSGKTTVARSLLQTGKYMEAISTTTRSPREGEIEGDHYYFVDAEEFESADKVESVQFVNYSYALTTKELERCKSAGKIIIAVVEPNGMHQINKWCAENNWTHFPIYLDCNITVCLERYLRHRIDFKPSQDCSLQLMDKHAARLFNLVDIEKSWVLQCETYLAIMGKVELLVIDSTYQSVSILCTKIGQFIAG